MYALNASENFHIEIACPEMQLADEFLDASPVVAVERPRHLLATLSVGTTAVERPVSAVIRCILSGGGGDDRWFSA